ncbi:ATP-binding protein [Allosphingosinicella deserti]|uniref:histidine kinase n=1 Tax=Allosphingosinicella deserti TaxID=2116704 RepID=A0A2P7QH12_9SPHN|nr:ATP-binding protein [Sphingomonas deserti]PSJ37268.1 two-component sensor histidine kinase [Sphingomonas deserti]
MRRFFPRSLLGQMALLIGAALLVAQLVNFALILNERQKLSLAQNQGPAITRYAAVASDLRQAPADFRFAVLEDSSRRGARFAIGAESAVTSPADRDAAIERRLAQTLAENGVPAAEVRAQIRSRNRGEDRARQAQGGQAAPVLLLSARYGDQWLNGRLLTPRPDPWLTHRLGAATLALYLIVLGATLFVAMRLARPLRDLARAAEGFAGRGSPEAVESRGPADLRRAIEAFNAMNQRVVALLDEKDRMLGAIGHDLRTPLASLRIRAEGMEPEADRARMAATIQEMNSTLEDILVLARSGRDREAPRAMDVAALADALVEEFRELGKDVEMEEGARQVLTIRPNLLRRAVRNLIDNAVKYGGAARVSVGPAGNRIRIEVRDSGPGIPEEQLAGVIEPFARMEQSRSRDTGGSGLGLAIAKAAAETHGGTLILRNAPEGGLIACLEFPS